MNLGELKEFIEAISNKDQAGNSFTPEQFNLILKQENLDLFNIECEKLKQLAQAKGQPFYKTYYNANNLNEFEVISTENIVGGKLLISTLNDYAYPITGIAMGYNGGDRKVDFDDDNEVSRRRTNLLTKPPYWYPMGVRKGGTLYFYPNDIALLEFTYLKFPAEPNYDYCIRNSNYQKVYMPVGSNITAVGPIYNLYSSVGVLLAGNVLHLTATVYPYTSTSIELEWAVNMHIKIAGLILSKMAVNLRDQELQQYSLIEEKKQQT